MEYKGSCSKRGPATLLVVQERRRAMKEESIDVPGELLGNALGFRTELRELLNGRSKENGSDTPDFILADYLCDCLEAYDRATRARAKWYGPPVSGEGRGRNASI